MALLSGMRYSKGSSIQKKVWGQWFDCCCYVFIPKRDLEKPPEMTPAKIAKVGVVSSNLIARSKNSLKTSG